MARTPGADRATRMDDMSSDEDDVSSGTERDRPNRTAGLQTSPRAEGYNDHDCHILVGKMARPISDFQQ